MTLDTFDRRRVRAWMRNHANAHTDQCGDVNMTSLSEAAAAEFNQDHLNGPLDDPDHWIWEVALDVATHP